jgi:hypothetical protein
LRSVRLYDPGRRPVNWTEIIGPGQFSAFSKALDTGLPCDPEGRPFADAAAAACVLFDSLDEARAFCESAVLVQPGIRFDVFDASGRVNPPLLTVVHASRARTLDTDPRGIRLRRTIAWLLIVAAVPVLALAYSLRDVRAIFPGFIGINMILAGGRLLWFNLAVRETERAREARLQAVSNPQARR